MSSNTLPTELPPNAGRAATGIAIVLVAQLMLVLDATVVNVALPRIDEALTFGPASLSWVLNAYTLAFGGLLLLGGRLGDVFGRLKAFEIGLAVFTVASALGGLAQTPGQLVAARTLQGVGAALAAPSELARRRRAQPRLRALRRRLLRRRLDRPAARRPAHRRRLVALDAVHQRPDRRRRAGPRPALRR
jgi:MFS family permease